MHAVNGTSPADWENVTTINVYSPFSTTNFNFQEKIVTSATRICIYDGGHIPSWFQNIVFKVPFEIQTMKGKSSIGDSAFKSCQTVKELSLWQKTSIELGKNAFAESKIKRVISLVSTSLIVGEAAFHHAQNLVGVTGGGYIKLAKEAFAHCTALESITVHPDSLLFESRSEFESCTSLQKIQSGVSSHIAGHGYLKKVQHIAPFCLKGTENLSQFPILPNCTQIGASAMLNCKKLPVNYCIPNIINIAANGLQGCQFERVPNEQNLELLAIYALGNNSLLEKFEAGPNLDVCLNFCANCKNIQYVNLFQAKSAFPCQGKGNYDHERIERWGLESLKCFVLPEFYFGNYHLSENHAGESNTAHLQPILPHKSFIPRLQRDFKLEKNSYFMHLLIMSWTAHINTAHSSRADNQLKIDIFKIFKNMKLNSPNPVAMKNVNLQYDNIFVSSQTPNNDHNIANGNEIIPVDNHIGRIQIFQDFIAAPSAKHKFDTLLSEMGWELEKKPYDRQYNMVEYVIRDGQSQSPFITMSRHGDSPDILYLEDFFYNSSPSEEEIAQFKRTRAGVGMQLVYLLAVILKCKTIEVVDEWRSSSNTSSDALQDMTEEKYIKRGKQYGFTTAEKLVQFRDRTIENGFYGAWGFKRKMPEHARLGNVSPQLVLNVEDYIPTQHNFV